MMRHRVRWAMAVWIAAAGLVMVGIASGGRAPAHPASSAAVSAVRPGQAIGQGTFVPRKLKHGGSLTVLEVGTVGGEWTTGLDPATSFTPATNMDIENSVFGSLFELVGRKGQLVPDLATGYQILDVGKTVNIFLRKGVKFSDGTPFNASAVVFNWNRDFQLKANDLPNWPIASSNPFTVSGPYTATIHFATPYTPVINTIHIHDVNWIVSPTALNKMGEQQFRLTPVGAGPFTVVTNTVNNQIVLKKNPLYWQKGLPYLDKLTFKSVASDESALEALQSGQAQGYVGMSTLQLLKTFQSSFRVTSQETADPLDVQFNTTKPPFNNILAREAVYYATNAKLLNARLYQHLTPVVEGFTGPGGLFYSPKVPGYRTYNLAKAKALVKQLGGLSFTMLGASGGIQLTLDEALQAEWQAAGMKVKLQTSPDLTARIQTFLQNAWQISPGGDGSFDPAGGVGDWFWFLSTSPYSGVHDPALDALIQKANQVPAAQRGAVYQQIAKYQSDHALAVQLFPSFEFDVADRNVYAPCLTTVCPTSETAPEVWWQNAGYTR